VYYLIGSRPAGMGDHYSLAAHSLLLQR
jgi:hypothetical protein